MMSTLGATNKPWPAGKRFERLGWEKTSGGILYMLYDMCTLPKFNSSPLKSYLPNRKGLSSNHHFSGAMLNFGGVYKYIKNTIFKLQGGKEILDNIDAFPGNFKGKSVYIPFLETNVKKKPPLPNPGPFLCNLRSQGNVPFTQTWPGVAHQMAFRAANHTNKAKDPPTRSHGCPKLKSAQRTT